jgi:hypothetical protein
MCEVLSASGGFKSLDYAGKELSSKRLVVKMDIGHPPFDLSPERYSMVKEL